MEYGNELYGINIETNNNNSSSDSDIIWFSENNHYNKRRLLYNIFIKINEDINNNLNKKAYLKSDKLFYLNYN
ncbi:hypothetical protein QJR30_09665 [Paraclostridium sordellii]|uniref:hypothetical protein n=1 Tax=Paraclostridium sordellii TaxID=1505 RepID=UPI0006DCD437|nr:hypothetical protein [Paeniclostridium sordellii]